MFTTKLRHLASGWRGISLVATTCVYFLIFAQFAFLNRLGQLGIADANLQIVMAAMAFGGIGFSLLPSLKPFQALPRLRLQISFLLCAAAAALTRLPLDLPAAIALALLIGAGLGLLTVTLVANLRLWIGAGDGLWKVGLGTGIGYFICNVPALFTATPAEQALTSALLCLFGVLAASKTTSPEAVLPRAIPAKPSSFAIVLVAFTALVWLDSAAFFIIQNTPSLKAGTWQGTLHLWANGLIHLTAALAGAFLLRRRGVSFVLGLAVLALAVACLLLRQPDQVLLASLVYPVGVSLYSVALVAWPSLLAPSASPQKRAFHAGLLYAVAGWFGSAMGIGMGQHLRQVPVAFVLFAVLLILGPATFQTIRRHQRQTAFLGVALAVAYAIDLASSAAGRPDPPGTAAERGRQVYIAEGCIHCHSQYVRPGSRDDLLWGPTQTIAELRSQHPPLIGNRRQGPDLSQIGGRRSPLWLEAHLISPRSLSPASFMPSSSYLFSRSERGNDLVQYLAGLKSPRYAEHIALEQRWQPSAAGLATARPEAGAHLYGLYCATCHEASGATRTTWRTQFKRLPPNLRTGPWLDVPSAPETSEDRLLRLARIVKFGIPETNMPGHEYLSDEDTSSIALWLNQTVLPPVQTVRISNPSGENR